MKKSLLTLGLVVFTMFTHWSVPNALPVYAEDDICSTEEECDDLIGDAEDELSDLKDQEAEKELELADIETQIQTIILDIEENEQLIESYEVRIDETEAEMVIIEGEIIELEVEIEMIREIVELRMRASQRMSHTNMILDILSESDSFVEVIRQLAAVNRFAKSDQEQMDVLRGLVTKQQDLLHTLQAQQQELVTIKSDLESTRAELVNLEASLSQQQQALADEIQKLSALQLSVAEVIQIAEEQKQIIANLEASTNSTFIIPMTTGYVTCEFMCYPNHTGIDLGNFGDTSTPIVASAAGVVSRSGWHVAYGYYVMITHNMNGQIMTTVYAHLHSMPLVSVGQHVSQGQKLGTMGNTGNSFGAHLHFEIYVGVYNYPYAQNPRNYINFPSRW